MTKLVLNICLSVFRWVGDAKTQAHHRRADQVPCAIIYRAMRQLVPVLLSLSILMVAGCSTQAVPPGPTSAASTPIPDPSAAPTHRYTPTSTEEEPTLRPSATPTVTLTPTITRTPTPWSRIAPGIESRHVPVDLPDREVTFYVYVVRIDPSQVEFRVHYDPEQPRLVEEWQAEIGAGIVLNGGFFSGNGTPVGRIVMDGQEYGYPLNYGERSIGVAGIFSVLDGSVDLYAVGRSSYSPRGLRFDHALESYPMLVLPGSQPVYPTETGEAARRTVIALDNQRRVIVLVSDIPIFTLHSLAGWLANSDLNIDSALNLDGGRSSGLVVALPGEATVIPSYVPVPIVLGIYPKHR